MKLLKKISVIAALAVSLAGCASAPPPMEETLTVEYVAEQLQCANLVEEAPSSAELSMMYSCFSLQGDGPLVVMFEAENNEKLNAWLDSGALEVGANDVVYGLDNLAVLATDNGQGIEATLEELFGPPVG